ncbi:hypothetical protein D9M73_127690 [compost metagenome]
MSALGVRAQLRFIERYEGEVLVERHRFGGAQEPARVLRHDLFFAGDQRDASLALQLDDPVIDFARQQPQRKADHTARMATHPLDREMGLAGVGRAQHCRNGHRRSGAVFVSLHDPCNIACQEAVRNR